MKKYATAVSLALLLFLGITANAEAKPYAQVVDNANSKRFAASNNWKISSWHSDRFRDDYRWADPAGVQDAATFKMRVPSDDRYRILVRWPANNGYNPDVRVGIVTADGMRWRTINQQQDGGKWNRIATVKMKQGWGRRVIISRKTNGKGFVLADAVRIVRVEQQTSSPPPQESAPADDGRTTGADIVREARGWLGVPYQWAGTSRTGVDCSGLTMQVFGRFDIKLPHSSQQQYNYGRKVSNPVGGDLVFGDYGYGFASHVGISTGKFIDGQRQMINAPYPGTVVRYDPISPRYTVGIKRLVDPN